MSESKCPSQSCHDNVTRLNFFMKIVGCSIGIIVLLAVTFSTMAINAETKQNDQINKTDKEVTKNTMHYEYILKSLGKMEATQDKIWKALKNHAKNNKNADE